MAKILYLVRGLPGSGKSTLAASLTYYPDHREECECSCYNDGTHLEADMFHMERGVYKWRPEKVTEAHAWCQRMAEHDMGMGRTVAVSNTFTRQWEMEPYRELARKYGYTVTVVTVDSGLDDAALAARNVHNVPTEAIARMRSRWEN